MNQISTSQLRTLETLFQDRKTSLKQILGGLQLTDVKEDSVFKRTVSDIKGQILLKPVVISPPSITHHGQTTRKEPYFSQVGRPGNVNFITVEYRITGSEEIFYYRGNGSVLTMASIYCPADDVISVEVQLPEINKEAAINEANKSMATTFTLIEQNNPDIERWSAQMEPQIQAMAEQKRKELIDLYS